MASIRAVRFHVEPGQTRVWFETTGPVLYTHYSPDPLTLVVNLPGVDIKALSPRTVVGSREVESVLATSLDGVNGKKLSRIEIKLAALAPYQNHRIGAGAEYRVRRCRGLSRPRPRALPRRWSPPPLRRRSGWPRPSRLPLRRGRLMSRPIEIREETINSAEEARAPGFVPGTSRFGDQLHHP